ncbi:uncharacterized protein MYCFIDRAFT_40460 [Pseudocercospora fijiensis CIRAD86]|uniref:25S rRNA adenine-N(1) methyltransferase n=1 Tax=Pseudocercospora fijiensis (strain CIRAD86) TaxID=383855 RepID=M3ACQ5_PSEFD|nr:uncharacterized protein MYCFIDRAFT_40460 [Pseudocercospora fijiensis CIRAD86]EME82326.1 hypothetical protein MYCFIDRAFT_40460 [Pseudocercospora fijiensis CIRAD86]
MASNHKKRPKSLKSGRPPTSQNQNPKTLSSKTTQAKIVKFHHLNKSLASAKASNNTSLIRALESEISSLGGLKAYQEASILGQSSSRGGDSSIVLVNWLQQEQQQHRENLRMLEIGALSTRNACSKHPNLFTEISRIDLSSQAPGILKQDFMHRPLPTSATEFFSIISLSLVLNFVPTPEGRGEMLRRTTKFLKAGGMLFLVLPAPCVLNSRYFDDERLTTIMGSLGYVMVKRKVSRKLGYWLWELRREGGDEGEQVFGKVKVRDGPGMNNFYVELRAPAKEVV